MGFLSKLFTGIGNIFKASTLRSSISKIRGKLGYFEVLSIPSDMRQKVSVLRGNSKYIQEVISFDELEKDVEKHNESVKSISAQMEKLIADCPIQSFVDSIEAHDKSAIVNLLKKTDVLDSFRLTGSSESVYNNYRLELARIIDNYDDLVEIHGLIKKYNSLNIEIPDRFMSKAEVGALYQEAESIYKRIHSLDHGYYAIPEQKISTVEVINKAFVERHLADSIFDDIEGRRLDEEQRRAVLTDAPSNLVVAGAGSGKTTTICGKVKYLLESGLAKKEDILLMSYSRASADDLAERVSKVSKDLKVETFHSLGLDILNSANGSKYAIEDQFKAFIQKYFTNELPKNPSLAESIFRFFSCYLYSVDQNDKKYASEGERFVDLKNADFKTLKDRLRSMNQGDEKHETIKKELVKSYEELVISNYLYINGINYEYERSYEYDTSTTEKRQYTPDFYLTDYKIYIEHYGINRAGEALQYTEEEAREYVNSIAWKRALHAEKKTVCLETYSYEFQEGTIFDNLKKRLEEKGVQFKPLGQTEIMNALNSIYNDREFGSFYNLVLTFLSLYKSQYKDEHGFDTLKKRTLTTSYDNARVACFLEVCKSIYLFYIREIRSQNKIDFDDMILRSMDALDRLDSFKYKYIIVDEFQDISQSRTRFLKKLIEHGNSKLFAVGDDWQAIYRFAGCDISVFLSFEDLFPETRISYLTSTHRNSSELQAIVEPFITKNPEQYKKHICSDKHQESPVRIIYHDANRVAAFDEALDNIAKVNPAARVLVLGRNRHDVDGMISYDVQMIDYETIKHKRYPNMEISYRTVHGSKGLESDYVILISCENAKNGFPNKMEDDVLLSLVLGGKSRFPYAEERRLFYVALTRTRSIVYILSDKNKPSEFLKEIEGGSLVLNPELVKTEDKSNAFKCPWCKDGKLVIRKNSSNKKSFYGCSNYPYCNYTNDNLEAVQSNRRCPACGDFMVKKKGQYGAFYGCSQYPKCKAKVQIQSSHYKKT